MSAATIDPSARIETGAEIGPGVTIGPYCTIGPHVTLGEGCRLVAHVNLTGRTTIGPRTVIHPFASLGSPPQSVHYRGGPTRLVVGAHCDIREHVTMNIGTEDGGGVTEVGERCFLMVGAHVGHDCKVGNDVVFANNILLAGHVSVGDYVVFGGGVAVRQFVRIGEGAMIVGLSGVRADVIPWGMVLGSPFGDLVGLNAIGMRRRGFAKADIQRYRAAFRALFFGDGEFRARLERVAAEYAGDASVGKMIDFIRAGKRPLTMASKRSAAETAEEEL
ncbi:MAG: acyl-ACP--UDP-N-acetylglucosamine O-acyltransferase [Pseudolabrys sp.]